MTTKKTPAKKDSPGARKIIGDALAAGVTQERMKALVDAAFEETMSVTARCPDCGKSMQVPVPDLKKQADTLIALLEQAEGRPAANQPEATTIVIERPAFG